MPFNHIVNTLKQTNPETLTKAFLVPGYCKVWVRVELDSLEYWRIDGGTI